MNFASLKEKLNPRGTNNYAVSSENFLALTLTPNSITACVWYLQEDKVKVSGISRKHFETLENLTHEAAVAIDKATEKASSDVEKVVFGLTYNWFEKDTLSPQASKLLDNLSRDLDLSAQAFVSLATAVNHFLKVEENITPNAVIIGIFDNFCEAHLIANNKTLASEYSKAKPEIGVIVDLIRRLKEKNEQLPARIVLYGGPPQSLNHKMGSRNWQDLFMHVPKIELLDENELDQAVAYAQAADMIGHDPVLPATIPTQKPAAKTAPITQNFGFVADHDILESPPEEEMEDELEETADIPEEDQSIEPKPQPPKELKQEDYAIDIANVKPAHFPPPPQETSPSPPPRQPRKKFKIPDFAALFTRFQKRFSPKTFAIVAGAALLAITALVFIAGQVFTSAQVVIKVNSQAQEADFVAKVVSDSADIESGKVPGNLVTGKAEGKQTMVATGTKKTGTKATGKVKILNWDKQSEKTFNSGVEIITGDGLKFKLDSEVTVASRSATTPGENTVGATASDIGPKYNISSGVDFTIVGFDEVFYSGVSDSAFTGGDEKQTTVASQQDLDKLEKLQIDNLTSKAKEDLNSNAQGKKIYPEAETAKVTKKNFDKKVDEEASTINLDMAVEVSALTFEEGDLKTYLSKTAQDSAPQNLEARSENIEIINLSPKNVNGNLTLSGRFRANLTPKINEDDMKTKIVGQSTKKARELIKEISGVSDVQVNLSPSIPFIDMIPKNKSKISFKIEKN